MRALISRFAASGVLMIWGVILVYFKLSGRVASYLHPSFHLFILISGIILILLSAALLLTLPEASPADGYSSRGFCSGGALSFLVLTIPLLASTGISQSRFGVTALMNRGLVDNISGLPGFTPPVDPALPRQDGSVGEGTLMDPSAYLKKNAEGFIKAETVDLLYAATDAPMRSDFENKDVEIIGQFMPARTRNPAGNRFNLVRLFVMCCAADARPVALTVQTATPIDFPEMTWVKVVGKATFPVEGGRHTPFVMAQSVKETEPPRESFIY